MYILTEVSALSSTHTIRSFPCRPRNRTTARQQDLPEQRAARDFGDHLFHTPSFQLRNLWPNQTTCSTSSTNVSVRMKAETYPCPLTAQGPPTKAGSSELTSTPPHSQVCVQGFGHCVHGHPINEGPQLANLANH